MSVHRIRLIGPWEFTWQPSTSNPEEAASIPKTGAVKMPSDWASTFGRQAGVATFSRKFHRPTNLEPNEAVLIVLTGVGGNGCIRLNGQHLRDFGGVVSAEVDVTQRLEAFNTLEIELSHQPMVDGVGGLYSPVVLEIRQS